MNAEQSDHRVKVRETVTSPCEFTSRFTIKVVEVFEGQVLNRIPDFLSLCIRHTVQTDHLHLLGTK